MTDKNVPEPLRNRTLADVFPDLAAEPPEARLARCEANAQMWFDRLEECLAENRKLQETVSHYRRAMDAISAVLSDSRLNC